MKTPRAGPTETAENVRSSVQFPNCMENCAQRVTRCYIRKRRRRVVAAYALSSGLASRGDAVFCCATDMYAPHIHQSVPLWRHKSYEPISTATKRAAPAKKEQTTDVRRRHGPSLSPSLFVFPREVPEKKMPVNAIFRAHAAKCSRINPMPRDVTLTVLSLSRICVPISR